MQQASLFVKQKKPTELGKLLFKTLYFYFPQKKVEPESLRRLLNHFLYSQYNHSTFDKS